MTRTRIITNKAGYFRAQVRTLWLFWCDLNDSGYRVWGESYLWTDRFGAKSAIRKHTERLAQVERENGPWTERHTS